MVCKTPRLQNSFNPLRSCSVGWDFLFMEEAWQVYDQTHDFQKPISDLVLSRLQESGPCKDGYLMKQLKTWPGVLDLDTLEILKLKLRWDNINTQYLDSRHWSASAVVHPHPIPRTRLMCWVNYRSFLYFPTALPFFCIFIVVLRDVR
ncbi:hypothetical protein OIU85_023340 [Salix viminalis]|uniref:Uncharacterized protein n=1 Tax=Salix viminalis TaxID=40686 RepID=A0A9Q0TYH6_SALVM|nr:hypothetical protein OIU85_023340 [Salix viminalis]